MRNGGMGSVRFKGVTALIILLALSALLLFRLGHHVLWDDEAGTVLHAVSLVNTGDFSAIHGHNIYAYGSGVEMVDLKARYLPPLQSIVAAPFIAWLGRTAFAARLPFALCGILTVAVLLLWLWRSRAGGLVWAVMGIALVGNVSFLMFMRQSRYYALCTLASVSLAYLYFFWKNTAARAAWAVLWFSVLLTSNYLNYFALLACLAVDYLVWGRKRAPIGWKTAVALFLPQAILGFLVISTFNPLARRSEKAPVLIGRWVVERVRIFGLHLREIDTFQFGVGILLLLIPLAYVLLKRSAKNSLSEGLLRGFIAVLVYAAAVAALTPQSGTPSLADQRYLAPIIPLTITLEALVLVSLAPRWWVAVPAAFFFFATSIPHLRPPKSLFPIGPFVLKDYVMELIRQRPSFFAVAIDWIKQNVAPDESVLVLPPYATYPLMFHAPEPVYAWQLRAPREPRQFESLPDVHFAGRTNPDVVIALGPAINDIPRFLGTLPHEKQEPFVLVAESDLVGVEGIRPELPWHAFEAYRMPAAQGHGIYMYRREKTVRTAKATR